MAIYSKLSNVRKLTNSSLGSIIDVSNLNFTGLSAAVLEFLNNISYNETTNSIQGLNVLDVKSINVSNGFNIKLNGVTTFNIDSQGRARGNSFLVEVAEARRYRHTDFNNWPDNGVPGEIIYTGIQNQKPQFGEDFIGYLNGRGWVSLTQGDGLENIRGVTVDGEFISGAQQTINTGEVLDIPLNFEYNLFTFNLEGTAIIDGDLNIIDDSLIGTPGSIGITYGRFGISNTDGEYTYYDSLYLAMVAATAGDTVEMFADYVETNSSIVLKEGVNINFNGHTYTLNTASILNTFTNDGVALTSYMYNGKIVRSGGSNSFFDSAVIEVITSPVSIILNGVDVINNVGACVYSNSSISLSGGGFRIISGGGTSINASDCEIINGSIQSNGVGIFSIGSVIFTNSTLIAAQGISTTLLCEITNSKILSQTGTTVRASDVNISGSTLQSLTGLTVDVLNRCRISSSTMRSVSGTCIDINTTNAESFISNCSITSVDSGRGILINLDTNSIVNISHNVVLAGGGNGIEADSTSGILTINKNTISIPSSLVISSGILATQLAGGGSIKVIDNNISVQIANINSHAINSSLGSLAISYVKNSMETTLGTLIGLNVIQAQINTEDNFGNIEM